MKILTHFFSFLNTGDRFHAAPPAPLPIDGKKAACYNIKTGRSWGGRGKRQIDIFQINEEEHL